MTQRVLIGLAGWIGAMAISGAAAMDEPSPEPLFRSGEIWPDDEGMHINAHGGGILLHEGTFYWFGEHKTTGRRGNRAWEGVRCYSSSTLHTWKNEGIALAVVEDPDSPIVRGCVIERPKVIYNPRTKTFVMWFHLELAGQGYDAAQTGLAVADTPTGPYRFVKALRPHAGIWPINADPNTPDSEILRRDLAGGQMSRDMTLFVDDDGTGYHIHASEENVTLHIAELTDDFQGFTGRYARVLPGRSNEAPALFKRKGTYHLLSSGCTGWQPNAARLATATHIFGPWTQQANPCVGTRPGTGMGPELTFGGQSTYILPVPGRPDAWIAMFDEWRPRDAIDGRYLWLPIQFDGDELRIEWMDAWGLSWFDRRAPSLSRDAVNEGVENNEHVE